LEWDRIEAIQKLRAATFAAILPINNNRRDDGVMIFTHMTEGAGSGEFRTFHAYLAQQMEAAPDNCLMATKLALQLLQLLQSQRRRVNAVDGLPLMWGNAFWNATPPEIDTIRRHLVDSGFDADGIMREFLAALQRPCGMVTVSWIHGDLNLTNILVTLGNTYSPTRAYLIDLSHAFADRLTVIDYATLEIEVLAQIYRGGRRPGETSEPALHNLLQVLAGAPASEGPAVDRASYRITSVIREAAFLTIGNNYAEYFRTLHVTSVSLLKHRPDPVRTGLLIQIATEALSVISALESGIYSDGAKAPRRFPNGHDVQKFPTIARHVLNRIEDDVERWKSRTGKRYRTSNLLFYLLGEVLAARGMKDQRHYAPILRSLEALLENQRQMDEAYIEFDLKHSAAAETAVAAAARLGHPTIELEDLLAACIEQAEGASTTIDDLRKDFQ
jgi:hypothetical protein